MRMYVPRVPAAGRAMPDDGAWHTEPTPTTAQNDLTFLRVRSKKYEIMIAPDKEYLLIVIQNPAADDGGAGK